MCSNYTTTKKEREGWRRRRLPIGLIYTRKTGRIGSMVESSSARARGVVVTSMVNLADGPGYSGAVTLAVRVRLKVAGDPGEGDGEWEIIY